MGKKKSSSASFPFDVNLKDSAIKYNYQPESSCYYLPALLKEYHRCPQVFEGYISGELVNTGQAMALLDRALLVQR